MIFSLVVRTLAFNQWGDTMRLGIVILFVIMLVVSSGLAYADSVYELRKLTEDEWLAMSTEERLEALATTYKHERNKTFIGQFGRDQELYRNWGYEFYEMEDRYENYAFRNFEAYNILEERRRRWSYNEFGDRVTRMRYTSPLIWREVFQGQGTYEVYNPYNYINSAGSATGYLDGVWMAREGTDDWTISVIGAGALRTAFTPLTLSTPNMNGMSFDFQSANNSLKVVNSILLGPASGYGGIITDLGYNDAGTGAILRGGRFRRKLGVLTLGATYTTAYGVQGNRERGDEWRGTVSYHTPTPIIVAVRFLDDSPEDGEGGPIVYDVRIKVNGKSREDIIPTIIMDDVTRDRTTAITEKLEADYLEPQSLVYYGAPKYEYTNTTQTIPKYADLFYLQDLIRGNNSETVYDNYSKNLSNSYYSLVEQGGSPIQANGTEALIYFFDLASIGEKMNRIEATATVANDYRIQTAHIYTLQSQGGHDTSGKNKSWYDATYWRTVAQADGNIKDNSNVRTIKFDFGLQVASVIYGFDADFNYRGFQVRGEFVTNTSRYLFPDGTPGEGRPTDILTGLPPRTGHYSSQSDHAYYLIMEKDWNMFGFSGEVFKMGKFYRPWLDYFYPVGRGSINVRNQTARAYLIEDNDDNDLYPDTMLVQRTMGYRISETEDPDGVFPGNDMDNDGIADNNKNNNRVPDYNEPFLMFDVDPDDFVFGNDYNNNTIPDFREDDLKPDTPYDLDRQGRHFILRFSPQKSIDIVTGSFRTRGVGTSTRTNTDYLKSMLNYDVFGVGKLYAEYRYERTQDNIRDPYIQVETKMQENYLMPGVTAQLGRFDRDLYYDELEYRNSNVNRLFLDSAIRALPSITLENHIKYERNSQIEGTMYDKTYQPHDVLSTLAMVNKIVYTKRFGNFVFSPGVKFRLYKKVRSESLQPLDHYLMRIPLVMFKYIISPRTDISLGFQGIPGMALDYSDFVQTQNDFEQVSYKIQLQNRTSYFGYNIWAAAGFTFDQINYDEAYRQFEEYKSTTTYLTVYLGW